MVLTFGIVDDFDSDGGRLGEPEGFPYGGGAETGGSGELSGSP